MKKLILMLALMCAAAVAVKAQDLSSLSTAARLAYDELAYEGYRPYVDEDGDVSFRAEGYYFYVQNSSDDTYLRIIMPEIKTIDTEDIIETYCALLACNEICRDKKLVKAYLNKSNSISLSVATYIDETPQLGEYIETALDFLIRSRASWIETFNENMED
jgi:hypothetical protein